MHSLVVRAAPHLKPGAIVTDVGSVKRSVVAEVSGPCEQVGAYFIGSHPMAGSDKTGVASATGELFEGAICVVTPTAAASPAITSRVETLWRSVGCRLLTLSPEEHDRLVSRSSHLPHVIAATLAGFVLDPSATPAQAMLCANGFRDTTRIASGSPEMWRDIAVANADQLCRSIEEFSSRLAEFCQAVRRGETASIAKAFEQAKQRRDAWASRPATSSPE
jgi:prephenate dehydrogenase